MLTERKPLKIKELQPPSEASPPPVIVYETEGCVMATWRNLAIAVWGTQGTVALAKKLDLMSADFIKVHPEGVSSVNFITKRAPLPDAAAREEFSKITGRYAANVACVGTVLDGSGFWVSAMQSFLTGLHLFSRRPFKTHYCLTIGELARWLPAPHEARTGVSIAAAEFEQVLDSLRMRVD
jgi:hypothetical protein